MPCTCKRHPGKFEGQPALAALAYHHALNGSSDYSTDSESGGDTVDFYRSPFNFDTDGAPGFAAREGYCAECIASALDSDAYGIGLFYSDYGFVRVVEYGTEEEYDAAVREAEGEDVDAEPCSGDYTISPCGRLGSRTSVGVVEGRHVGEYATDDEAELAIVERMRREAYYPDVWTISDHGNAECVTARFMREHFDGE